jgi:hypothetical protein
MKIKKQYSLKRNRGTSILENADAHDETLVEDEILQNDPWEPPVKAESFTAKCGSLKKKESDNFSSRYKSVGTQRKRKGTVNTKKLDRVVQKEVALWQELAQKAKVERRNTQKRRSKRKMSKQLSVKKMDTNKLVLLS